MASMENGVDDYTEDGTVDRKGNPVRRSKTGGWNACSFIIGYEVFERMAYYGIASNLVVYLTTKLHEGTVKSANNVTNWGGTIWMTPILGAYIADAHLGRYWTFVFGSIIYLAGMSVLTLSVSLPALRPPPCDNPNLEDCERASTLQLAVFYGALYILAVGTGATKPNISTMGADQFDDFQPKEKAHKLSFFNWWMFGILLGTVFAYTVIVYIQERVGWALGYGVPTLGLFISVVIFLTGTPFYRHKAPSGSSYTRMARVIVAALRKWRVPLPSDPKELYELDEEEDKKVKFRMNLTPSMRFLNKAAVKTSLASPWMLCSVTQVEETKQMLRMIPIMIATIIPGTMLAQLNTLFVKQGTTLDRNIGSFKIPPASLGGFVMFAMLISVVLYDRFFVVIVKRWTKNPRGITILQRIGIGMIFYMFTMLAASLTERYRLKVAREHGLVKKWDQIPLTIFILTPQFVLMGIAEGFLEAAKLEFFYDQAPEDMKSFGASYYTSGLGIGSFISSFLLSTVSHITSKNGHQGWILNNLNTSHFDYYYALLAVLNFFNLIFFLIVVKFYAYKAELSDSLEVLGKQLKVNR